MADYKAAGVTGLDAVPKTYMNPGCVNGKVRVWQDTYEADGVVAAKTIEVARLPKGARILPGSVIAADALGSGVTLACGDGTTADKFFAATAANTADKQIGLTKIDPLGTALTADTSIVLTVAGATATGTIKAFILYSVE